MHWDIDTTQTTIAAASAVFTAAAAGVAAIAASAARDTAQTAERQIELGQRPILIPGEMRYLTPADPQVQATAMPFTMVNVGSGAALEPLARINDMALNPADDRMPSVIAPGDEAQFEPFVDGSTFWKEERHFAISYRDVFGNVWKTEMAEMNRVWSAIKISSAAD
jgi:hypothetical protein